jgi:hypothetical protein
MRFTINDIRRSIVIASDLRTRRDYNTKSEAGMKETRFRNC